MRKPTGSLQTQLSAMTLPSTHPQTASPSGDGAYDPDQIFAPLRDQILTKPVVIGQLGQTLDGRIATLTGESRGIGGKAGLSHLQRLRMFADAVVVGAGTIAIDNPRLNLREFDAPSPARVVLDPRGRITSGGHWLADDGAQKILISSSNSMPKGCNELIRPQLENGLFDPHVIISELFKRGYKRLLIEGGAKTLAAFISARAMDRLHIVVSPVIFGSGKSGLELPEISSLSEAMRPKTTAWLMQGGEVLFDCDLRESA